LSALTIDDVIKSLEPAGQKPRLLLHTCCAPCATSVLEYLAPHFAITAIFCEDNIRPQAEYEHRKNELQKLLRLPGYAFVEDLICPGYKERALDVIDESSLSAWDGQEGGARCAACFEYRLRTVFGYAQSGSFEYFATTLTVSPHKNAALVNEIGSRLASSGAAGYLASDFKKKNGFARGVQLSKNLGLYRQNYCGCTPATASSPAPRA